MYPVSKRRTRFVRVSQVLGRIGFNLLCALIGSVFVIPLLWLFSAPFNAQASLRLAWPAQLTLDNFVTVMHNELAMRGLVNSLIQGIGVTVLTTLVAALAAYSLSRSRLPGQDLFVYALILFSSVVTGTVAMVPLFLLCHQIGLIDSHVGVILVFTGGLLPVAIFLMKDFVDALPKSYEEAAQICGASTGQMLRDVLFPLLRPALMVVGIWTFMNVWGNFLIPFILLRSPEKFPASVATFSFYTSSGTPVFTTLSAYSLLYALPILAMYLWVNARYGFRFFGGIKQ
ncbi:carbohydrate ABC transporter permease [Ensifer adhaerens]